MNKLVCLLILCGLLAAACTIGSTIKAPDQPSFQKHPVSHEGVAGMHLSTKTRLPKVPLPKMTEEFPKTSPGTVRIGSFNIQVFGQTKASKPEVMEILAKIIRGYDVIAVEEIRDTKGTALPVLVDLVNAEGAGYQYVVGERQGRTSSKEQYAYIFNPITVSVTDPSTFPEPEGTDPFHREPFLATVKSNEGDFAATLIVIHTDPDFATQEITALADVIPWAEENYSDPDVILMGDFNADGSYFNEDSITPLHSYHWIIPDSADTTVSPSSNTYDRIVITESAKSYYTGESGEDRFDITYGLSQNEALAVSDHYPVYAVYSTTRQ